MGGEKLEDWSAINLDFVIGGVDSCGTASLHLNLEKHSESGPSTDGRTLYRGIDHSMS